MPNVKRMRLCKNNNRSTMPC